MTYLEECNKWFAPLDEIQEAITNNEGLLGMTNNELLRVVNGIPDLRERIEFNN